MFFILFYFVLLPWETNKNPPMTHFLPLEFCSYIATWHHTTDTTYLPTYLHFLPTLLTCLLTYTLHCLPTLPIYTTYLHYLPDLRSKLTTTVIDSPGAQLYNN